MSDISNTIPQNTKEEKKNAANYINIIVPIEEAIKDKNCEEWVSENTAILMVHGIGNQLPAETVDEFGRGLVRQYEKIIKEKKSKGENIKLSVEHLIIRKQRDRGATGDWFDNALRLTISEPDPQNKDKWKQAEAYPHHIDIYEYYWANFTENKADWGDISAWLKGVTSGAEKYYGRNAAIGKVFRDSSPFFDKKGEFRKWRYRFFVQFMGKSVVMFNSIGNALGTFISYIPIIGAFAKSTASTFTKGKMTDIANVVGDIVAYNVVDPKSKYYSIRRDIHEGAVKAIKFLLEKKTPVNRGIGDQKVIRYRTAYPRVIVAGHSLGSQVAYDAINKVSFLVSQCVFENYDENGKCKEREDREDHDISDQLKGFITFGSPLDKLAFFVRENIPTHQFVRKQILDRTHCFKNRNLDVGIEQPPEYFKLDGKETAFLNKIQWRNYYDSKDHVSGNLDYYFPLINIDCQFGKKGPLAFTHSNYWNCEAFYRDIICNYLQGEVLQH